MLCFEICAYRYRCCCVFQLGIPVLQHGLSLQIDKAQKVFAGMLRIRRGCDYLQKCQHRRFQCMLQLGLVFASCFEEQRLCHCEHWIAWSCELVFVLILESTIEDCRSRQERSCSNRDVSL